MKRSAWNVTLTTALFMLAIASPHGRKVAAAQQAEQSLNDKQTDAAAICSPSHCVVCHVQDAAHEPSGTTARPCPKMSLGGQEDVMRELISNGTPNMPGFKYHFRPEQIDAIVAYVKTLPVPAPAAPAPPPAPR